MNDMTSTNKSKRRLTLTSIFIMLLIILILCITLIACSTILFGFIGSTNTAINEHTIKRGNNNKIAIIKIEGKITSEPTSSLFTQSKLDMTHIIIKKLDKALHDDNVKAVLLEINSPGGEVYSSEMIYNKIIELKKAKKHIVSLFKATAASGAYYIATPSEYIVASETTITGSIGVIIQTQNMDGLYEKLGIKTYNIVNSKGHFKASTGDLGDPKSQSYYIIETILDDVYNKFVDVIVKGRGLTKSAVIQLADGRVYSGKAALKNGLVDGIGYYNDALKKSESLMNETNPTIIEYTNNTSFASDIGLSLRKKLNTFMSIIPNKEQAGTKISYMLSLE